MAFGVTGTLMTSYIIMALGFALVIFYARRQNVKKVENLHLMPNE